MTGPIVWMLVLVALAIGMLLTLRRPRPQNPLRPYVAKGALCSPTETAFLAALDAALPPTERAFAQVRLVDVIEPATRDHAALNRVISKQLDFVICDRRTLQVLYAIELNDRSHDQPRRRARDAFLAEAMHSAGVPLYFFKAAARYSPDGIRARLNPLPPGAASPRTS